MRAADRDAKVAAAVARQSEAQPGPQRIPKRLERFIQQVTHTVRCQSEFCDGSDRTLVNVRVLSGPAVSDLVDAKWCALCIRKQGFENARRLQEIRARRAPLKHALQHATDR